MTNKKRIGALLLCIGLLFALFISSAYITHEAGHDCSGDDCMICQVIAINMNLLQTLGLAVLALLVLYALLQVKNVYCLQRGGHLPISDTLVSWKIRLND